MMNRPHFRRTRRPRPTDPDPEYSRLDRLDGLHTRIDRLDGLPTRYDAEWPDVHAAEAPGGDEWSSLPPVFEPRSFVGGDLAAMAAPADWPGFTGWGEGYEIEPEMLAIVTRSRRVSGYFWLPCPVCGEHFSGADARPSGMSAAVPDPKYWPGSGRGLVICPRCIAAGRGVSLTDVEAVTRWLVERRIDVRAAMEGVPFASPDLPMVRAAATAYDLGLRPPLRSDPPIYRACLAGHVGAGVGA